MTANSDSPDYSLLREIIDDPINHLLPHNKWKQLATLLAERDRLKAENDRLMRKYDVVRSHAIAQDCGRMCDNNKDIKYREQWKNSEQYVDNLVKQALSGDKGG